PVDRWNVEAREVDLSAFDVDDLDELELARAAAIRGDLGDLEPRNGNVTELAIVPSSASSAARAGFAHARRARRPDLRRRVLAREERRQELMTSANVFPQPLAVEIGILRGLAPTWPTLEIRTRGFGAHLGELVDSREIGRASCRE